jgi:hypothetical protein
MVFTFALPDPNTDPIWDPLLEWDPIYHTQDFTSLRDKKAFSLVNRLWREVSIEFIFRYIEISDISALLRLVDTLQQTQGLENRGQWISHLHLKLFVPTCWRSVYVHQVCTLLSLAPNLISFINMPIISVSRNLARLGAPYRIVSNAIVRSLADNCGQHLQSVKFGGDEGLLGDDTDYLLSHCTELQSFSSTTIITPSEWCLQTQSLKLHTLRLHQEQEQPSSIMRWATAVDDFPFLKHLSLTMGRDAEYSFIQEELFRPHGNKLESLFWSSWTSTSQLPRNCVALCPNLRLLAYHRRKNSTHTLSCVRRIRSI